MIEMQVREEYIRDIVTMITSGVSDLSSVSSSMQVIMSEELFILFIADAVIDQA